MAKDRIDEKQVDLDLKQIEKFRNIAWQRNPQTLLALIERLKVTLLLEKMPRRRRNVYRAIIDYYEDVLEERVDKDDDVEGAQVQHEGASYLRKLLKSLNEADLP